MTNTSAPTPLRNPLGSVDPFRGKWRVRRTDPVTGKRRSHGIFKTREEAWLALASIALNIEGYEHTSTDVEGGGGTPEDTYSDQERAWTVQEWVEEMKEERERKLKPETFRNQQSILNRWVLPPWGGMRLTEVTTANIDRWYSELGSTTGEVNRRNIYSCFSAYLRAAVKRGLLAVNPAQVEGAWARVAPKRPYRTPAEGRALILQLPEDVHVMMLLSADIHLRPGEARGLNRGDYNPKTHVVRIERQDPRRRYNPKTGELMPLPKPKGDSVREVMLTPEMVPVLEAHLAGLRVGPKDSPMFPGRIADRVSPSYVREQWLKARHAVGDLTWHIHDLRGVGLTAMADMKYHPKDIKARSGHKSDAALDSYMWVDARRNAEVAHELSWTIKGDSAA